MILGFKKFYPWHTKKNPAPTYFREKILAGVKREPTMSYFFDGKKVEAVPYGGAPGIKEYSVWETSPDGWKKTGDLIIRPKIHTMREDPHNRWKVGRSIQMVYRGPKYSIESEFNKGIPELQVCKGVQDIEIKWSKNTSDIGKIADAIGIKHKCVTIKIDDKIYFEASFADRMVGHTEHKPHWRESTIFQNDGFNDLFEFFRWFNKDWKGKIIHWTDFKY